MSAVGRNATHLSEKHPLAIFDENLRFVEDGHAYYVRNGNAFLRHRGHSVTGILKKVFPREPFDKLATFTKYQASWRKDETSKYHTAVAGKSDEEARASVFKMFDDARDLGTLLHLVIELYLNKVPKEKVPEEIATEFQHFLNWMEDNPNLEPFRTELGVLAKNDQGAVVMVGQADAVFLDKTTNKYVLVDFKRTDKDLTQSAPNYNKYGVDVMQGVPFNPFFEYSLQAWLYASMLQKSTELEVSHCLLLQLFPTFPNYKVITCKHFQDHAEMILWPEPKKKKRERSEEA